MNLKAVKAPTPARVDALETHSSAASVSTYLTFAPGSQALAVSRLSRRFGLPPSTVLAVAEANRWGC